MNTNKQIFQGKTLSNLFEEIYNNSKQTKSQLHSLIAELKPLVESAGDATLIVPLIKEYLEVSVKNDDHLIKLATIIQRLEAIDAKGDSEGFDFGDLEALVEEQSKIESQLNENEHNDNNITGSNQDG
jgi:hypothetical protein